MTNEAWCEVDDCPVAICGSKHVKIVIQDGDEVIINAEQADRINAGGDTATYRWSYAHLMEVINPPEEPKIIRIATENGFLEILPPRPWRPEEWPWPTEEEMREASARYLRKRYGGEPG